MRVMSLSLLAIVACLSCQGEEGQQVVGAVESFIEFGMSNEERAKAPRPPPKRPHLHERSRKTHLQAPGGPRLEVEVDLRHDLDSKAVVDALSIELDRLVDEGSYAQVKLTGRPAGLLRYGGMMGIATAKRGRQGKLASKVQSRVRDDRPPLSEAEYQVLVDLELAIARHPSGSEAAARGEMIERYGREAVERAVRAARGRYGR